MNLSKISYKIASWSLILVGIGHTITTLLSSPTAVQKEFIVKMQNFSVDIFGSQTNIYSLHLGFSLMMGLLLFGYGLLSLQILKTQQNPTFSVLVLNILITLMAVIISQLLFFIIPVLFTSVAMIGFITALITKKNYT